MARRRSRPSRNERTKKALILGIGAGVVAVAVALALRPLLSNRPAPPEGSQGTGIVISMAGFSPSRITVPTGQPVTLTLTNSDSQFHTDGGGWHQFAIDALKLDVKIPPHSEKTITLAALQPGTYEFYCDICCGGRANPSMIGILEVKG